MQNNEIVYLYLDDIIPNRFQPREVFDDEGLRELAVSIKEHGVIQPIIVRQVNNKYEIIAGERRYKASTMAGLTKIPAIIKNLDDKESSKVALIENLQRRDLTPIEEARTYQKILDLEGNMTQDQLAQTMGKTQSAVSNKLRLLSLPEEVQHALLNEQISERHARCLLNLNDKNQQIKLLEKIISSRMTVKELEKEVKMLREQEPTNTFGIIDSVESGREENVPVAPYTSTYGSVDMNPTEVDINKIRENSMDIMPEAKPAPDMGELMKSNEDLTNSFKFVPTDKPDDTDSSSSSNFGGGNANKFFGVTEDNSFQPAKPFDAGGFGVNENNFNNNFSANPLPDNIKDNNAVEEADGLFGNIPSIGSLPGFTSGTAPKESKPFDFGVSKDLEVIPTVSDNTSNSTFGSQTSGNMVSKFLTDIPSLQNNVDSVAQGINNVALAKMNNAGGQTNSLLGAQNDKFNVPMQDSSHGLTLGVSAKQNIMSAVGQFRDLVKTIENQGYSVSIEELDVMNEYQILIKIDK